MNISTRIVLDWDGNTLEQDSFEYSGPVALCGGGGGKGSTPSPPPPPVKPATGKDVTASAAGAVEDQAKKAKKYMGQQGTILTSPLGAAPTQQTGKTLLGQ